MFVAATPAAYAAKATAGSGVEKATYSYDTATAKATYKKCKATGAKATVPATVKIKGTTYKVVGIASKAFAKSKATTVTVKTKKLAKARVKNALKGSMVSTVKVNVGTTPKNNEYAAKYKKFFTKANAGKAATVKASKVKATAKQKIAIAKAFAKAYYTQWTFKNGKFSMVGADGAEKAIAPYLATGCTRDESWLDAAPFFQYAEVDAQANNLYVVTAYSYYTQNVVTETMWANYQATGPFATEMRIVLNKYGLVTSLVS